jgi:uncharacterized damage-inducible protein DinB
MNTPLIQTSVQTAVFANLDVIQQGIDLLADLNDARYTQRLKVSYNASIGGHMRHIIDHYLRFLAGLETNGVAYENRERDTRIETDRDYALDILHSIHRQLETLHDSDLDRSLHYVVETNRSGGAARTSMVRELEYLLSHTIHHYALIAIMARLQGYEPAGNFGVAPSTLRYLDRIAAGTCAR